MGLSNAQRQRRYIDRLKAAAHKPAERDVEVAKLKAEIAALRAQLAGRLPQTAEQWAAAKRQAAEAHKAKRAAAPSPGPGGPQTAAEWQDEAEKLKGS